MASEPPAPDLGAQPFTSDQRAHHLERMNSTTGVFLAGRLLINRYEATVVALEAERDAQAARLAAVEAERDALRCKHCSLTGTAHHEAWLTDPAEIAALRERATRLVALETAARAWAADVPIETGEAGLYLLAVIAGLDAPPGESS